LLVPAEAESKFKDLGEAHAVLKEPKKKSIVRINAIFSGICKYSTTLVPTFSSFFPESLLKLTGIFLPRTDFVLATPLFQAQSCLQGERHRAAVVIAADSLNDGCLGMNIILRWVPQPGAR